MDTKLYPKKSMRTITTSTIVTCATCKQPSGIYEPLYKEEGREVYHHVDCVSDDKEKTTETKTVELQLTDDLNVKSEGN